MLTIAYDEVDIGKSDCIHEQIDWFDKLVADNWVCCTGIQKGLYLHVLSRHHIIAKDQGHEDETIICMWDLGMNTSGGFLDDADHR